MFCIWEGESPIYPQGGIAVYVADARGSEREIQSEAQGSLDWVKKYSKVTLVLLRGSNNRGELTSPKS